MGSMLGLFLKRGGADVTLVVRRKELAEKFISPGIVLKYYGKESDEAEEKPVPMKAQVGTDGLSDADAVVIMTKGPDTKAAMESARAIISRNTKVITLQNGIGNIDIIREFVAEENILYGCMNMSAIMESPGVLTGSLFEGVNVYVGAVVKDRKNEKFGKEFASVLTAGGASAEYTESIDYEVWSKLLVNIAVNATCGLVRLRGGEAGSDQNFIKVSIDMIKEAIAVAAKLGVELDFNQFMTKTLPAASKTSGKHYPSMAQDMMIGKARTEIDFINGAIEKLGEKYGVPTPVNTTVARLVRTYQNNYAKQFVPKSKGGSSFTVAVNEKFCKGCGFCIKYCAQGVLALETSQSGKGYVVAGVKSGDKCVGCLNCTAVCPEAAITISKED